MTEPTPTAKAGRRGGLAALVFNVQVLRVLSQLAVVVALVALAAYLADNYNANIRERGGEQGWGFLDERTGFDIGGSDFRASQPVRDALVVGIRNTAQAAFVGMIIATVLGIVIGIIRLSRSWVASKVATLYVEVLRNIPVLLIILFVVAWIRTLPQIDNATSLADLLVISNVGVGVVSPVSGDQLGAYVALLAVGLLAAGALAHWRTRVFVRTGEPHHRILYGGGLFLVVALVGYFVFDSPITLSRPEVSDGNIVGGARLAETYAAITVALAIYHASHIAEIVRGSVQAVPHGQTEAATAIGLSDFQRLRFVILPQAFRIAVPPIINQLLSLTKNTSLGIAASYPEIFTLNFELVGSSRSPAVQSMVILMAVYLMFSLTTSLLLNIVNKRLQLVER